MTGIGEEVREVVILEEDILEKVGVTKEEKIWKYNEIKQIESKKNRTYEEKIKLEVRRKKKNNKSNKSTKKKTENRRKKREKYKE